MALSVSYTKKGPGIINRPISSVETATYTGHPKVSGSKLNQARHKRTVGLKNPVHSLVQAHFDEKARERFLSKHN